MNTQELILLRNGYNGLYSLFVHRAGKKNASQINGHEMVRLACSCECGLNECNRMIKTNQEKNNGQH